MSTLLLSHKACLDHDLGGDRIRRLGTVDQPPGDDDLLVAGGGPLEIGHRDPAVRAELQRLEELLRLDRLRIALALDRELVHA